MFCCDSGVQPYLIEYFLYDSRRLAGLAVENGVVNEDSGLTLLATLPGISQSFEKRARSSVSTSSAEFRSSFGRCMSAPDIGGKQVPRKRKGRKARRQAKLEAEGAAVPGSGDSNDVADDFELEL